MQLTKVVVFMAVAVLLLVSHQLILSHNNDLSPWNFFSHRPQNAKINTTVLFMVTSYGQEFTGRQIVRETYLSVPSDRSAYFFIIGQGNITEEVKEEQAKYQDIYFLDCDDGYYNLSDKIIMGLKVAVEHFDFQYVVKVDTDTFVDVPRFIDYVLEKGSNSSSFYAGVHGYFNIKEVGWRTLNATKRQPSMRPSWYMLGGGYVLSRDLADYFAENGHLLQVWAPEDLTIGVHLHGLNVKPHTDHKAFLTYNKNMDCKKDYLLNHKVSKSDMYYLHYSTLEGGRMCEYTTNEQVRNAVHQKIKEAKSDTLKSVIASPKSSFPSKISSESTDRFKRSVESPTEFLHDFSEFSSDFSDSSEFL